MTDAEVTRSLLILEQHHAQHHMNEPDAWADLEAPIWRQLRRINPGVWVAILLGLLVVAGMWAVTR